MYLPSKTGHTLKLCHIPTTGPFLLTIAWSPDIIFLPLCSYDHQLVPLFRPGQNPLMHWQLKKIGTPDPTSFPDDILVYLSTSHDEALHLSREDLKSHITNEMLTSCPEIYSPLTLPMMYLSPATGLASTRNLTTSKSNLASLTILRLAHTQSENLSTKT